MSKEILWERTIKKQGSFRKVVQRKRGWHPEEGKLAFGQQGKETIVRKTVIDPVKTYTVKPRIGFSDDFSEFTPEELEWIELDSQEPSIENP